MISNFRGLKVTVMGLGSFGGAIGAARFLARQGARVTITDLKPAHELADSLAQLSDCPPESLRLGGHDERDFREADLVVASPAVPEDSPYLRAAAAAGVPITSEINLFWERNRGRTVCITGSNGKSTTAALVHAVLAATLGAMFPGRFWLGLVLLQRHEAISAEKELRQAIRLRPKYPLAYVNLGRALQEQGKKVEADKAYREALHLRPYLVDAHVALARLLRELGDPRAGNHVKLAQRLHPDDPDVRKLAEESKN